MSVVPSIDGLLGGFGLIPGRIVEFCGLPGSGKTALTTQVIANLLAGSSSAQIIIFDNNGFFPVQRLFSMVMAKPFMSEESCMQALERVHVCHAILVDQFVDAVDTLLNGFNQDITLVVVDNIANYFRSYPSSEVHEKVTAIKYIGMLLRQLARRFNVPVLVNNHLTTAYREKDRPESCLTYSPYLGDSWTFMVDQRIKLKYCAGQGVRSAEIVKSTYSMRESLMRPVLFKILEEGIVDLINEDVVN